MKRYIIWIEGLEPKYGEKVRSFTPDGKINYTTKMTKALRVRDIDLPYMRNKLERAGIARWVLEGRVFVETSYTPKGTLLKF